MNEVYADLDEISDGAHLLSECAIANQLQVLGLDVRSLKGQLNALQARFDAFWNGPDTAPIGSSAEG
jgi:hypothetical protein